MNKNYSVPRLTSSTPDADRLKLKGALEAVAGVGSVILKPGTHQFEVRGKDNREPNAAEIAAASLRVGFKVEAPPAKKAKW